MPRFRSIASLLLLIALIPSLAMAEREGRIVGKIVDPDKKPIPGVAVTVTSPDIENFKAITTTDKKGVFTVDFPKIDVTYVYRFDKTGYQSVEAQQTIHKPGSQFFDWTMPVATADAAAVQAGAAPASTSAPAIEAFNAGVVALKSKDYATAETKFAEATQHDPNLRQAWEALSAAQVETGHFQAAATSAEKAIALGSTEESVYLSRWKAYKALGDEAKTAEALKDLEKSGRRAEEAKRIHNEAVALVKAGDNAGAFAKFQEALAVDPNLQPSLFGLAKAALALGKNTEAFAAAEQLLKADPKNEQAVRIQYNAALGLGDKAKIETALMALAPYEPTIARDGFLKLAFESYDKNDNKLARSRFMKALEIDPTYPQAYYYLGVINAAQGATKEARAQLQKFLQLAPNDPEAKDAREMLSYLGK